MIKITTLPKDILDKGYNLIPARISVETLGHAECGVKPFFEEIKDREPDIVVSEGVYEIRMLINRSGYLPIIFAPLEVMQRFLDILTRYPNHIDNAAFTFCRDAIIINQPVAIKTLQTDNKMQEFIKILLDNMQMISLEDKANFLVGENYYDIELGAMKDFKALLYNLAPYFYEMKNTNPHEVVFLVNLIAKAAYPELGDFFKLQDAIFEALKPVKKEGLFKRFFGGNKSK